LIRLRAILEGANIGIHCEKCAKED
jgi:hypothetical protein